MISDYQERFIKEMTRQLNTLAEKNTKEYEVGKMLITLAALAIKPILEDIREDVDIVNQKINDEARS